MGIDIHVKIVKYNTEDNYYHELSLYRLRDPDEKIEYNADGEPVNTASPFIRISPYDCRDYEMFEGMNSESSSEGYGIFPSTTIALGSLEPELRAEMIKEMEEIGVYGFQEISFADLENYLHTHPTVVDFDAEEGENWKGGDPKPQKENPIKELFESCINYTTFAEKYVWISAPYSYYKILFWFDH